MTWIGHIAVQSMSTDADLSVQTIEKSKKDITVMSHMSYEV